MIRFPLRPAFVLRSLCAALVLLISAPVEAQTLQDQVRQLKRDVEDLQRQVFRGEAPATPPQAQTTTGGAPATSGVGPATQIRVDAIEQELRGLTGKIEELQFGLTQARGRLDALSGDIDLRFQDINDRLTALEQGAPGAPTGPAQPIEPERPSATAEAAGEGRFGTGDDTTQTLGALIVPGAADPAAPFPETAEESYRRAYGLVIAGQYDRAEQELKRYIEVFGDSPKAPNAQYWLAETHYARKQYDEAAREFAAGLQAYPEGPKAADNLLKLGLSLAALGEKEKACIALGELNVRHPDAPASILDRGSEEQRKLGC
ncbi:MAG: tol-pal system protein YbgF [Alphaproteobacteria bacterium]|nr:tol-pal system protein YbgF [Alphaproteobacteria bacterium]